MKMYSSSVFDGIRKKERSMTTGLVPRVAFLLHRALFRPPSIGHPRSLFSHSPSQS